MSNVRELEINNVAYDIIGKGVVDQNNTSTPLKEWTGTKAQYDAIATKDANTVYNITDDTNPTQSLLEAIYPIGAIYIGTMNICPLSALFGTWTLISTKILIDIPATLEAKGNGMTLGLQTNTNNKFGLMQGGSGGLAYTTAYGINSGSTAQLTGIVNNATGIGITADSTKSGIVADTNATSLIVNIWQRTA